MIKILHYIFTTMLCEIWALSHPTLEITPEAMNPTALFLFCNSRIVSSITNTSICLNPALVFSCFLTMLIFTSTALPVHRACVGLSTENTRTGGLKKLGSVVVEDKIFRSVDCFQSGFRVVFSYRGKS